ncbi:MAG: 13E12 repeat family protein, partial [Actinomycetota bacterium]|nr:13E12 repeat family protein [Actinomycetota bacterium]
EDPRTFDQRRADALSAIFHAICDAGEAPLHPDHLVSTAATHESQEHAAEEEVLPASDTDVPASPTRPSEVPASPAHAP